MIPKHVRSGVLLIILAMSGPMWTFAQTSVPVPGTWSDQYGGYPAVQGRGDVLFQILGEDLLIGGSISGVAGVEVSGLARWDGERAEPFGDFQGGAVSAIASMGDSILVGGRFTALNDTPTLGIVLWTGEKWLHIGDGLENREPSGGSVSAIVAVGSTAYVGGNFSHVGDSYSGGVAKWENGNWLALGTGVSGPSNYDTRDDDVHALAIGEDGLLYAAGNFREAGGNPANFVAAWNGTAWRGLDVPFEGYVDKLLAAPGGGVYLAGNFEAASGSTQHSLAFWNGDEFEFLGVPLDGYITTLLKTPDGSPVVGVSTSALSLWPRTEFVRWSGSEWRQFATPLEGTWNSALTNHSGRIVALGGFFDVLQASLVGLAEWNGESWRELLPDTNHGPPSAPRVLGTTTAGNVIYDTVRLAENGNARYGLWEDVEGGSRAIGGALNGIITDLETPSSGGMFISGVFDSTTGLDLAHIAQLKDGGWVALGGGLTRSGVIAACENGVVFAAGLFTDIDGGATYRLARWEDESWSPIGGAVQPAGSRVKDLECGQGHELYLAGDFTAIGQSPANGLAVWKAGQISDWGADLEPGSVVNAIRWDSSSGQLAVGGGFELADGSGRGLVGFRSESGWHDLAEASDWGSTIVAIDVDPEGRIVVAGYQAFGPVSGGLATYDGSVWLAHGDGLAGGSPTALYRHGGHLAVAGHFTSAGSARSYHLADWHYADDSSIGGRGADERPAPSNQVDVSVFPNPIESEFSVGITTGRPLNAEIMLVDVLGRAIDIERSLPIPAGTHTYRFRLSPTTAAGVYFVTIHGDRGIEAVTAITKRN